jgi:hypothetical protein
MEYSMERPQKIKNRTTIHQEIPLVNIYEKETKIISQRDICTRLLTPASFTKAKIWQQPKCSLMDKVNEILWEME